MKPGDICLVEVAHSATFPATSIEP
jgi:hypothetical protein